MPAFKLFRNAFSDLVEIGGNTENKWGIKQRNIYLKHIMAALQNLLKIQTLVLNATTLERGMENSLKVVT